MPTTLTTDQILALAPDSASAKAGQGLASSRKWLTLGHTEQSAWGQCQGSGTNPYQTQIDLSEPAFHCSCPSRKFPCKHGLGLFLLLTSQPDAFTESTQPGWVNDWFTSRVQRAEKHAEKLTKKADKQAKTIVDPAAQARRAAEREKKVAAGLSELALRLRDLVRNGFATVQSQPPKFWETIAARMIDAQAPGVARLVRKMATLPATGDGWHGRLLELASKLFLLCEGFSRLSSLPPETQADIRTIAGWTYSQEELLAQPGLRDRWWVVGQRVEEEDRLRVQFSWLQGEESRRSALLLQFAHASQPLDTSVIAGSVIDAELVFYPGACPLRALIKIRHSAAPALDAPSHGVTIAQAVAAYGNALAHNPWIERFPFSLQAVIPYQDNDGRWSVRDKAGHRLLLFPHFPRHWELFALSGGHEIFLHGEWDGEHLLPLSVWATGRFVRLL